MTKKNIRTNGNKCPYRLVNTVNLCRIYIILLLVLTSLNGIKAQSSSIIIKDIKFESNGVTLAGTIYIPQVSHAAVVLVHGSGQAPRMGEFASLLADKGISVLTYDKRGVGESGGIYAGPEVGSNNVDSANLILLADDANAAVDILHQQNKNIPIGLAGISQAGWIIPIAADKNPQVNFIVLFSGPLVSTIEQLRFQFFTDGKVDFWDNHTEAEARQSIREKGRFDEYYAEHRDFFTNTDPYDALNNLPIAGLWFFGEKDIQVPVRVSIERLNTLKALGKPYEYCLFPALGHDVISTESIDIAAHWIKDRKNYMRNR